MSSRCPRLLVSALLAAALPAMGAGERVLRVCADPNNLPFSNQRGEGFENRLAEILARDLGAKLEYTWWPQRKSFVKNTLDAGKCDAWMGVPAGLDSVSPTRPYYRSTYVFLSRADRELGLKSLDDPRLSQWRIGVHVVGDDYAPPAHALARRGLSANLKGYSLFGEYGEENPPARIVDAVAKGDVDVAIVWGPLAGYFGSRQKVRMQITPVSPAMFLAVPFAYDISVGVRKGDDALRTGLDGALGRQCAAITLVLNQFGVPRVEPGEGKTVCESSQASQSVSSR